MPLHTTLTREIHEGPAGPQIGAFFDLDRTLIAGFSVAALARDAVSSGWLSPRDIAEVLRTVTRFQMGQIGFSGFVAGTTGMLRGRTEAELTEMGERIFTTRLATSIYPESRALVQAHHRKGHTVAVVSAATRYQIEPVARDLDMAHVLCTRLQVRNGRFTGKLLRPTCYGDGKATHVRRFARAHGIDISQSYFYTDSDEDLPLLEIVGNPRPTNPNRRLAEVAAARGWPTRRFTSRGTPGVLDVLRTSLAVGSLVPSFLLALPAAAFDGGWRRTVNIATTTWGELGTALAGVELQVTGEQHLWSHRPAVFIFNHQSGIDMLLLCKLLRRDMVGIAKQELRRNLFWGPAFALAGTVFVDRFNRDKAIEALQPAVDTLRQGLSLAIAPEGTRSPTPRLGRFKKGAFHLAMAAKVPIVPIVFRNALDALPKNAIVVRPATIEAVVHPPISTARWKTSQLDTHIEAIHQLYEETLDPATERKKSETRK
jgi:putative phosphoserine phosphatase / 1-acylglycerol-3-phosphate O-acyltransferase